MSIVSRVSVCACPRCSPRFARAGEALEEREGLPDRLYPSREINSLNQKKLAVTNSGGLVDSQHVERGSADRRGPSEFWPVPTKVLRPLVDTRVVKSCQLSGRGIVPRDVGRFERVAQRASPREIVERTGSMVLERLDVIDFVRKHGVDRWHVTVFTAVDGPLPHALPPCWHRSGRTARGPQREPRLGL